MSKQSLLLVDGDARSLRVLEVSLRKAGFTVTTAFNGPDALDKLALATPDLVISETKLEDMDGFELCKRIKANPLWVDIPFVFLTAQTAIEHKVKGLELGVDDYLTKPIYIKEVVTRLQILLQKRQRTRIEERRDGRTRFVGRLSDMAVVDLIQTIEISRKSGVIQFTGEVGRQAAIYFRDGKVIDAEAGPLQGEDAVYRLLTWNDGAFEVVFRTVRRRDVITTPSQGLLMEGMRRLDEWTRLCEQLPPLDTRFEVDTRELTQRLGDIPDENNTILKLMDGRRTLNEVIDACSVGDLECLQAVSRLYFEGLLIETTDGRAAEPDRRVIAGMSRSEDSNQWVVPATVFDETPVEAERIAVGSRTTTAPLPVGRVVTVPPPTGREGSGPRTLPPAPSGRRASGSNPIPIARTDTESGRMLTAVPAAPATESGRVLVAAAVTESGRFAAPPADPLPELPEFTAQDAVTPAIGAIELAAAIARTAERDAQVSARSTAPLPAEPEPELARRTERMTSQSVSASMVIATEPVPDVVGDKVTAPMPVPSTGGSGPTAPMAAVADPELARRTEPMPAAAPEHPDRWRTGPVPAVGPAAMAAELKTEFQNAKSDGVPSEDRVRSPSGSIEVGPLHGAFRPSGLRKIDEAVAAAQLIAPQLFMDDDEDDAPVAPPARDVPSLPSLAEAGKTAPPDPSREITDELIAAITPTAESLAAADGFAEEPSYVFEAEFGSVPDEYLDEEDERPGSGSPSSVSAALAAAARAADRIPHDRDDDDDDDADDDIRTPVRPGNPSSNPRIVASHGKDQAQVSGELPVRYDEWPEKETTARELVTIKPRRITREIPAVVPSPELMAEAEAMTASAVRASAAMASTAIPVTADGPGEPRQARPPLAATTSTGAATAKPERASRAAHAVDRPGPARNRAGTGTSRAITPPAVGWLPWIFGAIGVALLSAAYVRCRRNPHTPVAVASADAAFYVAPGPADAALPPPIPDATTAVITTADAPPAPAPDAAPAPAPDAAAPPDAKVRPDGAPRDAAPGYREYRDAAQEALDDNDYDTALELADKSLELNKSARTFLIKADALRRLDRIDDALAAVDAAIASNAGYAPAWEMKGRILWGARRLDEGRAAYEKYLELKPTGSTSDKIRELLGK